VLDRRRRSRFGSHWRRFDLRRRDGLVHSRRCFDRGAIDRGVLDRGGCDRRRRFLGPLNLNVSRRCLRDGLSLNSTFDHRCCLDRGDGRCGRRSRFMHRIGDGVDHRGGRCTCGFDRLSHRGFRNRLAVRDRFDGCVGRFGMHRLRRGQILTLARSGRRRCVHVAFFTLTTTTATATTTTATFLATVTRFAITRQRIAIQCLDVVVERHVCVLGQLFIDARAGLGSRALFTTLAALRTFTPFATLTLALATFLTLDAFDHIGQTFLTITIATRFARFTRFP
jgi:hypothetical protein